MYVLKATNIILLSDAAIPLGTAVCTNDQWNSCFEQLFITNEYSLSDAITSQMFAVKLRTKTTVVYKLIDICFRKAYKDIWVCVFCLKLSFKILQAMGLWK